ncbi:hypothetical protein RQP46_001695 [Phenoliferia psychrophenolica]
MPSIEEVDSDVDFSDPDDAPLEAAPAPPAPKPKPKPAAAAAKPAASQQRPPSGIQPPFALPSTFKGPHNLRTLAPEVYKEWESIYPIYIDAKRPNKPGARRVAKQHALQWPLAEPMAHICGILGFKTVYEPTKTHPKDWENPGRVKVQLRVDGKPVNPAIKDKRALLHHLTLHLAPQQPKAPAATPSNPHPLPPIHLRLPPMSPAISHGALVSALAGDGLMGGMGNMLGNMLGGGGAGGGEPEEPAEPIPKKPAVIMQKPRKVHMKKKRSCGKYGHEFTPAKKLRVCSTCNKARYCSTECQKSHWKLHRTHCQKDGAYESEVEMMALAERDRASCFEAFKEHYKKVEVALKYAAHSALHCHHPDDRHSTHALVFMWNWVAPGTTFNTVPKSLYADREFVLAPMDEHAVVVSRAEFRELLSIFLTPADMRDHDRLFTVEGMNDMGNLGSFDSSYRRIPVAMIGWYGEVAKSIPIVFTQGIAVNINPHSLPYPIDQDWLRHFRTNAALPRALVWEDHFLSQLKDMEGEAAKGFAEENQRNADREDAYVADQKKRKDAKERKRLANGH